jgi:hypothetical protein
MSVQSEEICQTKYQAHIVIYVKYSWRMFRTIVLFTKASVRSQINLLTCKETAQIHWPVLQLTH